MMHESEPGKRIRSYIELSQEAFGNGRILAEMSWSMVRVQSVNLDSVIRGCNLHIMRVEFIYLFVASAQHTWSNALQNYYEAI